MCITHSSEPGAATHIWYFVATKTEPLIDIACQACVYVTCVLQMIAGFITETGKSPIVGLFFLNMWGDCQVVPYSRGRTQSVSSEGKLEYAIQGDRNLRAHQQKAQSPSTCPQHYAIIVDETQIKVSLKFEYNYWEHPLHFGNLFLSRIAFPVSIRSTAAHHLFQETVLFSVVNISLVKVRVMPYA